MKTKRRALLAAPLVSLVLLAPAVLPQAADAATFTNGQYSWSATSGYSEFTPGDFTLESGDSKLVFQTDGNLVLYNWDGKPRWQSGTYGRHAAKVSFQSDGNVVVYRADNVPLWSSGHGFSGRSGKWIMQLTAVETPAFATELNSETGSRSFWRIP
ncbi:hypothetical protein B7R54_15975 [Subtercola boreus]|uniref:Bulb-type lectin domain-containing protein n=1 Tax=Subtercola boreus TaxID=120213 RepID=A0A3E0VKW9_9MICO|nr:hypothetical protein [Subtercola boreus]RFA10536.1 hypothetical protein B7R54_15975 [Subtercola boreus]TQL55925.1 D-mannose binding lectin [Subtercola boreus]